MTYEKVRENRLRRAAKRQGLILKKARRFDPKALDFGRYALIEAKNNNAIFGHDIFGSPFIATLDDVESYLTS